MKEYYKTLGVEETATTEEIKAAYRKKAKESHPDIGGDSENFKKINQAYVVLSDPEKRSRYDNGQDPEQKFDIQEQAAKMIIDLFSEVLENLENKTVLEKGVLGLLEDHFNKNIKHIIQKGNASKSQIKKLNKQKGKIKNKKCNDNIFEFLIDSKINSLKAQRLNYAECLRVIRYAQREIKNYSEEKPPINYTDILNQDSITFNYGVHLQGASNWN